MKKSFFRKILFYLSVPTCVGCSDKLDIDDGPLCKKCFSEYNELKKRNCSRCAKLLSECTCSNAFLETHMVKRLVKVFRYLKHRENAASTGLIFSLKKDNRHDVMEFLASELSLAIKTSLTNTEEYIITNVPRRKRAIKKYGLDHSEKLAKRVAKMLGCKYEKLITSKSKRAQKTLDERERVKNAEFDVKDVNLKGKKLILVDDIVTTGASMGACAMLLRSCRAKEIVGAALAVAYKDKYVPFENSFLP